MRRTGAESNGTAAGGWPSWRVQRALERGRARGAETHPELDEERRGSLLAVRTLAPTRPHPCVHNPSSCCYHAEPLAGNPTPCSHSPTSSSLASSLVPGDPRSAQAVLTACSAEPPATSLADTRYSHRRASAPPHRLLPARSTPTLCAARAVRPPAHLHVLFLDAPLSCEPVGSSVDVVRAEGTHRAKRTALMKMRVQPHEEQAHEPWVHCDGR